MSSLSILALVPARHVVVDGSNIATEGRSLPSLVQLDEAVREYRREFVDDVITVVVDATFGHRIDPSERPSFDEAVAHNEIVSPPAGAIGRGDAFLLRVAEKVGATVLSNDSFQEFHGEHEWLFNNGRLIGGKPVPGVGWIFTPRTPVRGPKSRDSMRDARRARRPEPKDEVKKVQKAIEVATEEAVEPDSPKVKRRRRGRGGAPPAEPVNEPLPFIEFVAAHPLGSTVEAEVESFSSHGAFVIADQVRCYIPLSGMGDPPPRAAKEVLKRGETRSFALQALDPPRRGIELALPEFAHVSGAPTPETVEDEINEAASRSRPSRRRGGRGRAADGAAAPPRGPDEAEAPASADVAVATAVAAPAASPDPGRGEEPPAEAPGPRKRTARPRAGAPRARPGAAPRPLEPVDERSATGSRVAVPGRRSAATSVEPGVPVAPAGRKRVTSAGRKTPATPAEPAVEGPSPTSPSAPSSPAGRKSAGRRKASAPSEPAAAAEAPRRRRTAKAAPAPEPVAPDAVADVARVPAAPAATAPAGEPAAPPAAGTRKRRTAKAAPPAPDVTAPAAGTAAGTAANKARTRAASARKAVAPAPGEAEGPVAAAAKAAAKAAPSRRAPARKTPAPATARGPEPATATATATAVRPEAGDSEAPAEPPVKKAARKRAAAKRQ